MIWYARLLHPACRPAAGDGFTVEAGGAPIVPAGFEEADEIGIVHAGDRLDIEMPGRDYLSQIHIKDTLQYAFGARRAFEGRHQYTTVEFGFGVAQRVFFTEYGKHYWSPEAILRSS